MINCTDGTVSEASRRDYFAALDEYDDLQPKDPKRA